MPLLFYSSILSKEKMAWVLQMFMICTTIQTVIVNTQSLCFTDMRYKTDFYFKLHSPYIAIWTHHRGKKCRGSF